MNYSSNTCFHNLQGPWGICQKLHSGKALQIPHMETASETSQIVGKGLLSTKT